MSALAMHNDRDTTAETMQAQGRALRSLARSILGGTDGADDVVQEAFATALSNAAPTTNRRGWLVRVVQNLARRRLRDRARHQSHHAALAGVDSAPPTIDVVADVEMHRVLADIVLKLGEPYRTALVLRYWHDLPPRLIARHLGVPIATVKTRLQRALAELRTRLDARGGDRRSWLSALVPIARPDLLAGIGAGTATAVATTALTLMNGKHLLLAFAALVFASLATWAVWPPPASGPAGAGIDQPIVPTLADGLSDTDGGTPASRVAGDRPANPATLIERFTVAEDEPTCTVVGRIVADLGGAPLADARLRLVNFWMNPAHPDAAARVDADGRFELQVPLTGNWVPYRFALAEAPGWAVRELRLDAKVQESIREHRLDLGTLRLERGVAVTGRVIEADGTALGARARLIAWDPAHSGSWPAMYGGRTIGFAENGGQIVVDERISPPAGAELMIAAICARGVGWTRLDIAAGQDHLAPIEIRLQPGGAVAVLVVDREGAPIVDAQVQAVPYFQPIGLAPMWEPERAWNSTPSLPEVHALFRRHTDAEGRASFTHLPLRVGDRLHDANRHQRPVDGTIISATAEGFITKGTTADPKADGTVSVTIEMQRQRRVAFHGKVVSRAGEPMAATTVRLNGPEFSTTTDAEGRYQLAERTYGGSSAYFLVEGERVPLTHVVVPIPDEGTRVEHDFVVELRAPVTGLVVDQFGAPVAGASILLGIEDGVHYRSRPEQTGVDGRFAFPDATATHDDLWITPPDPVTAWRRPTLRKLTTRDGQIITLERLAGELVDLHVIVVDGATGSAVAPHEARLRPLYGSTWDTRQAQPRTELALGKVTATQIRPGRYRLVVRGADGLRAEQVIEVTAEPPVQEQHLELWPTATLVCTLDKSALTAEDLASMSGLLVLLDSPLEDSFAVDERGERTPFTPNTGFFKIGVNETFRLQRVTPNVPLRLRVPHDGWFGEVWFRAEPGGETRVTLRVERSGVLALLLPDSLAPGKVEIDVLDGAGQWRLAVSATRTGGDDRIIEVARPPGPVQWRLRLWPSDGGAVVERSGSAQIEAGSTSRVDW